MILRRFNKRIEPLPDEYDDDEEEEEVPECLLENHKKVKEKADDSEQSE